MSGQQSISASYKSGFTDFGQGDLLNFPIPGWVTIIVYVLGWAILEHSVLGRRILAIGGGEDAAR